FQAEDGIRDRNVTGVQTCALPISCSTKTAGWCVNGARCACPATSKTCSRPCASCPDCPNTSPGAPPMAERPRLYILDTNVLMHRSEERRVGKEWCTRMTRYRCKRA